MNNLLEKTSLVDERRLSGVARLYGEVGYEVLKKSHVVVIGLGGVGSWAAEALARSAVGEISLIDYDQVSVSNTNRQLHAMDGEFGKSKVEVMTRRLRLINPELKINSIDDFLKPENMELYIQSGWAILDAMDDIPSKIALAAWCQKNQNIFVMSGGAGGKVDPTKIDVIDIAKATHDSMLSKIRAQLRSQHQFERDPKKKMGISVVYSSEPRLGNMSGGLSCAGYGSTVMVTASFGFAAAAEMIRQIISSHETV
jgi:molybdopterin/thiamine biosynthesis adenylyltransferase